jgi:hypothetical protein
MRAADHTAAVPLPRRIRNGVQALTRAQAALTGWYRQSQALQMTLVEAQHAMSLLLTDNAGA